MLHIFRVLVVSVLLAHSAHVAAQEQVATFEVSASVSIRCKVQTLGDIAFGALDPAQAINTFATTEASVACTRGATYRLLVDEGRNFDARRKLRQMVSYSGETLPYTLEIVDAKGLANGWFRPSLIRFNASVRGTDYIDLPAGQYQDVIRISIEY